MRSTINDYFFYKIVNINGDCGNLCYVGSTANWNRRLNCHKNVCRNKNSKQYNIKLYQTIRANGGWCEFKMIEIGRAEQLTQRQAEEIEETYRIALNADMNDRRCFVTPETRKEYEKQYYIDNVEKFKQYDIDNAEKIKEQKKQYYIDNIEKIKEYKKQYTIDNTENVKEYKKQYYIDNAERLIEKQKQYAIDNAEKVNEYRKQYRNDNKSKIHTHNNEKHKCACGGRYTTINLSKHNKTQQHQTYIKNNPIKIDACVECEN